MQLETTIAQKTEAEQQVKAEAKKSSDLNGLLGTFRDKLKTEREQGAASLSGMSDKLQTDLTKANDAHAAEVARLEGEVEAAQKVRRRLLTFVPDCLVSHSTVFPVCF